MKRTKTGDLARLAVLTALSVALAYVHVPTPTGFLTLLDVGIYTAAFYLGSESGAVVGGLSGFLIDLLLGYPHYMLHSLLAHGAQGYLAGWTGKKRLPGLLLAGSAMAGWYFVAALLLGYGWGAAWGGLPGNVLQNVLGLLLALPLSAALRRMEGN